MATQPFLGRSDVDAIPDGDEHSAARLHLELQHQLDNSPDDELSGGAQDSSDTHDALRHLHRRFPNAPKVARHETSEALGGLPRHLRNIQERERDEAGMTAEDARDERTEHRKSRGTPAPKAQPAPRQRRSAARQSRPAPRPAARRRGGSSRRARRAARAVVPGSWTRLAYQGFTTAVGLSLLYLLMTHGRAVNALSGGFGQAFAKLVSPHHDVIGGGPALAAPALTLDELSVLPDATGLPVDLGGLPHLTPTPPGVPRVHAPRAPAHPSPSRLVHLPPLTRRPT
jgi:hypothetical protein